MPHQRKHKTVVKECVLRGAPDIVTQAGSGRPPGSFCLFSCGGVLLFLTCSRDQRGNATGAAAVRTNLLSTLCACLCWDSAVVAP
jgi:hypothetical protein